MLHSLSTIVTIPNMQMRLDMGFIFILSMLLLALYINLRLGQTDVNRTKRADTHSAKNS